MPGIGLDLAGELGALGDEPVVQAAQLDGVDPHADALHARQHPHQRHLEGLVQRTQALRVERGGHRADEPVDSERMARR